MEERIRQRRALYTVLREWLDEHNLLQALQVFEEQCPQQPSIAVHDYLTQIAPLYRDKVDAKTLRRQLMTVLVRRSSDLAPDPLPLLQQWQARQEQPVLQRRVSPEQQALHELVSTLLKKLPLPQRKQMHAAIAAQLKQHFVNGSYDALAQYLLSDSPHHLAPLDDRTLRQFLSLIYVAACEVLGPVSADRWLAGSLLQLRESDQAAGEAVNRYL